MAKKKSFRPTRNIEQFRAAFARRMSNAASPIPSGKKYRRHQKHRDPSPENSPD